MTKRAQDPIMVSELQKPAFIQYERQFSAREIHFYLCTAIGEPIDYVDMMHTITTAEASDIIYIHLNTPGGQLDTGVQMINAMKNSQAKIVTVLDGVAQSLGTLIFLSGDEMIVNDDCMMMFHNYNAGFAGKGNELSAQIDATTKWFAQIGKHVYIPFLSEAEFDRIIRGEDLWMQSHEIRKRIDNANKIVEAEKEAKNAKRKKKPSGDGLTSLNVS